MYNRYIRNDNGSYSRIPEDGGGPGPRTAPDKPPVPPPGGPRMEEATGGPGPSGPPPNQPPRGGPPPNRPPGMGSGMGGITDGLTGFLRHILDQLHLDHVDTGDLLLLGLLFFLFREDADEELLVALGLLLIL